MKKLIILLFIVSIILSGCISDSYPKEPDAQQLFDHFQKFIQNDVSSEERLQTFINDITLTSININVVIEIKIYNQLNSLLETRQSSGVIYQRNASEFDVITLISIADIDANLRTEYIVKDVQGQSYEAQLRLTSEVNNLALFKFTSTRLSLEKTLTFADIKPYQGEPVILIGHQFKILNSISMGIVLSYETNELINSELMLTNIPSDLDGNGGVILNMNKEIIGIQFESSGGITSIIQADKLVEFINQLT